MDPTVIVVVFVQLGVLQRGHIDPTRPDSERNGQITCEGIGPVSAFRPANERLPAQREPRLIGARRRDDSAVKRGRCVPEQPHDGAGPQSDIVQMSVMHRLTALGREESDGDALSDDEGQQQQQRELAREAPGHEPHWRSTLPANR